MKRINLLLLLGVGVMWLVGCGTTPEPVFEPESNMTIKQTQTEVVAQLPTVAPTALLPTNTAVSPEATATVTMTPTPTVTPEPLPNTATPEPTPRPFATLDPALPPPTGQVVFLWDSKIIPAHADPDNVSNLYTINFEDTEISQWQLENLISNLWGATLSPSADKSKLAIRFSESLEGVVGEAAKVGIYDPNMRSWQRLNDGTAGSYGFDWMPDNETVIYTNYTVLWSLNAEMETDEVFRNPVDESLHGVTISPDGQSLALVIKRYDPPLSPLAILDIDSQSLTEISASGQRFGGVGETIAWSPDSQWVLFSVFGRDPTLVNIKSLEIIKLGDPEIACYPEWSPISVQLAYTCNGILYLWSADTQTSIELLRQEALGPPVWSPNGTSILASFTEGEESGFVSIEVESMTERWMPLEAMLHPISFFKPVFSPDGNWFLFLSDGGELPEVYLVSTINLDTHLLFTVEGKSLPYDFFWLSNS